MSKPIQTISSSSFGELSPDDYSATDYTWLKEEKTKEKLFDLKRLADTIESTSNNSSNPVPINLNSTRLLEQRLAYVKQLQFDSKQARRDILEDVDDQNDIIYEASKVFYFFRLRD